tara:strand:- start:250 stop:477 length:228 start_codon:yes stop_codon:yes gene_type:complete
MKLNKYDLAIVGEMVNITSKHFMDKDKTKVGDIIIKNIKNNPKHTIVINWNKIHSFIKKLEKNEEKILGFVNNKD